MDVDFWSQYVSFILVGIMIAASIRGFMKNLMKVFRAYSSPVSSNHIILLLAHVMGMYFTSSILLMRMKLPLEYRTMITEVLGDVEFGFYHRWFDFIFIPSVLLSILVILLKKTIVNRTLSFHASKAM
uniref:Abscisic acid G-protein coupled receptor-like domain-containing protein n=1 Tax=Vannella robusta TaxID=1487602 RepID=A0A7S4M9H9_9EUKA